MPGWFGWFGAWFSAWLDSWACVWLGRIGHLCRKLRRHPPAGQDTPNYASLTLPDGMQIPCAIFEDPHASAEGLRQFWLEPMRPIPPGVTSAKLWIDVVPPRSMVTIKLPEVLDGRVHATWRDRFGEHSNQPLQRNPVRNQQPPPTSPPTGTPVNEPGSEPGNGNRFGNGQPGGGGHDNG